MDDLISRQAAIDALGEEPKVWDERVDEYALGQREQWRSDRLSIEGLPSAEKKGKWIPKEDQRFHCSKCNSIAPKGIRWKFCPNCGADMRGEKDE